MTTKGILANCVIALSGDFGPQKSHASIKRWVEGKGGQISTSVTANTTHVVCTKERWEGNDSKVTEALKHKNIQIVSFDWLEDSLLKRSRKRVGPYLWRNLKNKTKTKKRNTGTKRSILMEEAPKATTKTAKVASKPPEPDVISEQYQVFVDSTGIGYKVTMSRPNPVANWPETCYLCLHVLKADSATEYACTWTTTTTAGKTPINYIRASPGSGFTLAFEIFRDIFKRKTGVAWERALELNKGGSLEAANDGVADEQANAADTSKMCYSYSFGEHEDKATKAK